MKTNISTNIYWVPLCEEHIKNVWLGKYDLNKTVCEQMCIKYDRDSLKHNEIALNLTFGKCVKVKTKLLYLTK